MDTDVIKPGKVDDLRVHGLALLDEHYDELCVDKAALKLDPDWDRYEKLIEAGIMFTLCVWSSGQLVGYSANIVMPHLHYRRSVWCSNDVLFVSKAHRRGTLGMRLIRATEAEATKRGANVMSWHTKRDTALEHVLPTLSYQFQESVFTRSLP